MINYLGHIFLEKYLFLPAGWWSGFCDPGKIMVGKSE